MRLPVPAVLTSNNFLSLPGKSASTKNKEERKKKKASLSRFFCYSKIKANNTMLEVDDVSLACPVTNRPVIRLARAGTNVTRADFFVLFILMPRMKFVVVKIALSTTFLSS